MISAINNPNPSVDTIFSKEAALRARAELIWNARQWKFLTSTRLNLPISQSVDTTPIIYPLIPPSPENNHEDKKTGD
jgi:hypothetical protein